MPSPVYPDEMLLKAKALVEDCLEEGFRPENVFVQGTRSAVCEAARRAVAEGLVNNARTFEGMYRRGKERGFAADDRKFRGKQNAQQSAPANAWRPLNISIEHPTLPDSEAPIEEELALFAKAASRRRAAHAAKRWRTIRVKGPGPIGIAMIGDPHMDSDGCNMDLLLRDVEIIKSTDGMFAGNVGDSLDNWVGRLAKLKGKSSTTDSQAWRRAKWLLSELREKWIFWLLGNHDCLDEDTEALTRRGWVRYDNLRADDQVVGLNKFNEAEWQQISEIIRKPAETREMVRYASRRCDMLVTPKHRILHQKRDYAGRWSDLKYTRADDMKIGRIRIPVCARQTRPNCGLSHDQLYLLGFLSADGGRDGNDYWRIYQSKASPRLDKILSNLGLSHSVHVRNRPARPILGRALKAEPLPSRTYIFSAESSRKIDALGACKGSVPEVVASASASDVMAYLEGVIDGDGSKFTSGRGHQIYGTRAFLESLQAVLVLSGFAANLRTDNRNNCVLSISESAHYQTDKSRGRRVSYNGAVWCLSVPLTNFLVRRNGKPFFTGNSWNEGAQIFSEMMAGHVVPMDDWQARFNLEFDSGLRVPIWAAHDFKGRSQFNKLHGHERADLFSRGAARLYVSGHHHEWACHEEECPERRLTYWKVKARGYKFVDSYAENLQYFPQESGASVTAIIDQDATHEAQIIRCFPDLEEAAEFLTWKRERAGLTG